MITCVSVTDKSLARAVLSEDERYFLISNCFSNSNICFPREGGARLLLFRVRSVLLALGHDAAAGGCG